MYRINNTYKHLHNTYIFIVMAESRTKIKSKITRHCFSKKKIKFKKIDRKMIECNW